MSLSAARWCLKHGNQDVIPKSLCGQHDRIWISHRNFFTKPLGNEGRHGAEPCQVLQTVAYALFPKPQLDRCRLISTSVFLQKERVINSRDWFQYRRNHAKYTRLCYCKWQCFAKQIIRFLIIHLIHCYYLNLEFAFKWLRRRNILSNIYTTLPFFTRCISPLRKLKYLWWTQLFALLVCCADISWGKQTGLNSLQTPFPIKLNLSRQ